MRIAPILDDAHFVRVYSQLLGFREAREYTKSAECPADTHAEMCKIQVDALDSVIDEMEEALKDYASSVHPPPRPSIG